MKVVFQTCRGLVIGSLLALVAGCATDPAPMGSRFVVSAPYAEFYKNGPAQDVQLDVSYHRFENFLAQQQTGPDFQLPKGAAVTMLKRESGYSKVITDAGVTGYIANEQLRSAPPVARASAPAEMVRPERSYRPSRTRTLAPPQKSEQLDLSDIPLPLPS